MVLQVTEHAVVSGDEVTAVVAFETFLDLLEVPASWMGAFFPALVKLSVETASNTQLELNTREQALQVRLLSLCAVPCCCLKRCTGTHMHVYDALTVAGRHSDVRIV